MGPGQTVEVTRLRGPKLTDPTERIIMSQTTAAKKSSMGASMILAGVLAAIAGWMIRNYAASQMHEARDHHQTCQKKRGAEDEHS
jgi:hypothetical protein